MSNIAFPESILPPPTLEYQIATHDVALKTLGAAVADLTTRLAALEAKPAVAETKPAAIITSAAPSHFNGNLVNGAPTAMRLPV